MRIALLLAAIGLAFAAPTSNAEPTQQFSVAGRFIPPAAPAGEEPAFTRAVAWVLPVADVAALFGLTPGDFDWSYAGLTVNVWVPPGERARVEAFVKAWMFVYRQDTMQLRFDASALPVHDWRADPDGAALLRDIRRLHASPGVEAKLVALQSRYSSLVSRWLRQRARTAI